MQVVSGIGDVVVQQWEGSNGETMKRLFGDFCSKQNDITVTFRELMKNDKKFQAFMKVSMSFSCLFILHTWLIVTKVYTSMCRSAKWQCQ